MSFAPEHAAQSLVVTAHHITNLPKTMQELDPARTQFRLTVLGLLRFVPSSIVPTPSTYIKPVMADDSGSGSGGTTATASGSRELPPLDVPFSPASILFRNNKLQVNFDNGDDGDWSGPGVVTGGLRNVVEWQILRGSSVPDDSVAVVDVFVGIKERKGNMSRWVSNPPHSPSAFYERFAFSTQQLAYETTLTRVVGTKLGQVAISVSIADHGRPVHAERVSGVVAAVNPPFPCGPFSSLDDMLAARESEVMATLRKVQNPAIYASRLQRHLVQYAEDEAAIKQRQAELEAAAGSEDAYLRQIIFTTGPELTSIRPKTRLQAFAKAYRINEQDITAVTGPTSPDVETESFFDALVAKFGPEPLPARYAFPVVVYQIDARQSLLEHLSFPMNKPNGKNARDIAMAARQKRSAFTNSPLERCAEKRHNNKQMTEIEILQEKHEPEFRQIVPSVADALQAVIDQHTALRSTMTEDDRFAKYNTDSVPKIMLEDYVHRVGEYTFISPASMIGGLMFIDRLCERHSSMLITQRNVYKLFFISVRVASKVIDVRTLNNKNFASVGGVSNHHLNEIEETFLKHLRFDLFVGPSELAEYTKRLNPPISHSRVPRGIADKERDTPREKPSTAGATNGRR